MSALQQIEKFTSSLVQELHHHRMPVLRIPKPSSSLEIPGEDEPEVGSLMKTLDFFDSTTRLSYVRVIMIVGLVAELVAST